MPLIIRIPHSFEILADSFVYSGVLVVLLAQLGESKIFTIKKEYYH